MIDKMEKLIEEQKEWSAPFLFNTTDSTHGNNGNNGNEESVLVDICSVLRRGVPYTFPNHYSGLDSKNRLIIELRVAAIKAGFNLTKRSSKSKKEAFSVKHNPHANLSLGFERGLITQIVSDPEIKLIGVPALNNSNHSVLVLGHGVEISKPNFSDSELADMVGNKL